MKVTTKTRYGTRAMVEIARCKDKNGIYQKDIAKNQQISNRYLDHIINALKVAQLIRKSSSRGGYILMRPASEISVYDINNAFEPLICVIDCIQNGIHCDREAICPTRGFWCQLNELIVKHYKSVSVQDLVEKSIVLEDEKDSI